jgi:glycine dehydrogenase
LLPRALEKAGAEIVHATSSTRSRSACRAQASSPTPARRGSCRTRRRDTVGIAVDETTTYEDILGGPVFGAGEGSFATSRSPACRRLARQDEFLTHPVFHAHHSETAMMRYLKQLADRDYALDRGMIPLGSCTMKLNAATEMAAVTWPEFAQRAPVRPAADVCGHLVLIEQLESWLAEITGYDAVSLQPNAGSQGELAGLLAIRGYHLARRRPARRVPDPVVGARHQRGLRRAGRHAVVVVATTSGQRRPRRPAREDRAARRRSRRS